MAQDHADNSSRQKANDGENEGAARIGMRRRQRTQMIGKLTGTLLEKKPPRCCWTATAWATR